MAQRARTAVLLAVLLALSACTEKTGPPPPVAVRGTVSLDGHLLQEGFLHFKTIETGAFERFNITNGEFTGHAQPGTRRVEIYANRPKIVEIDGENVTVPENVIDSSFNIYSKLTAEVTLAGPNHFRFEVDSK